MDVTPRYEDLLIDALNALVCYEVLEGAAEGVAKKIISDRGLERLSEKQRNVFDNYIQPQLEIICESEGCCEKLSLAEIPNAYERCDDNGGLFCRECDSIESQLEYLVSKND